MNKPSRDKCRELWEKNRDYVTKNIDTICTGELFLFAKKQDALYLAWFDDNYSQLLTPPNSQGRLE